MTIGQDAFWTVDPELMPQFQDFMEAIFREIIPEHAILTALQVVMADNGKFDFESVVVVAPYIRQVSMSTSTLSEVLKGLIFS